jgi:hypothetical protein
MAIDLDGRGATVGDVAFDALKLDGGVVNAEFLP